MSDLLDAAETELLSSLRQETTIQLGPVTAREAQRFAVACGDRDSIYFSHDAATEAGYTGLPVPSLYLSSVRSWDAGPWSEDLLADGTNPHDVGLPTTPGIRVLGGGQTLEFGSDLHVGEPVEATFRVSAVDRKQGRTGDLLVVTVERDYRRGDDLVLHCVESRLLR